MNFYVAIFMHMYSKERKDAMWKISLAISEYMINDISLSKGCAIEKYLEEIRYPGMNEKYRRWFIEMSLVKYPPVIKHLDPEIKLLD